MSTTPTMTDTPSTTWALDREVVLGARAKAHRRLALVAHAAAARDDEVLELALQVAPGARVPAEAVVSEGMWPDAPPDGVRANRVHGLVMYLDRAARPDRSEQRLEDIRVYAPARNGHGIDARDPIELRLAGCEYAVGHRLELGEIAVGRGLDEARVEVGGGQVALLAGVIVDVVAGELLVAAEVVGGLRHGHAEVRGDVAPVDAAFPEQAELDELEALLGAPAPLVVRDVHRSLHRRAHFLYECYFYTSIITIRIRLCGQRFRADGSIVNAIEPVLGTTKRQSP